MPNDRTQRNLALLLNGLPGWLLMLAGLVLVAVSLLADNLGLGGQPGIVGWKQWLGATVGLLAALGGGSIVRRLTSAQPIASGDLADTIRPIGTEFPYYDSAASRLPFVHELRQLLRYRHLLVNLVARDLTVRYKRSVLGFLWAMINPLLTMIVMAVVFTQLFQREVENYPIFLLSGLLLWRLFSGGSTIAMRSILGSAELTRKIYVPSGIFVAASVGSAAVNFVFALLPLVLLALATGVTPRLSWLFLWVPAVEVVLLTFGVGLIVAALAVFFADVLDIYDVLISAYFYFTPIIYPATILPAFLLTVQNFNPMYQLIDWFRQALLTGALPGLGSLALTTAIVLVVLIGGWSVFSRLADQFPYRT